MGWEGLPSAWAGSVAPRRRVTTFTRKCPLTVRVRVVQVQVPGVRIARVRVPGIRGPNRQGPDPQGPGPWGPGSQSPGSGGPGSLGSGDKALLQKLRFREPLTPNETARRRTRTSSSRKELFLFPGSVLNFGSGGFPCVRVYRP